MRVLYDISALGLGHLYRQSRGGSYRVDRHIAEGLASSGECELLFCANHSIVAFHGCEAFLDRHPRLGSVPLLAPRTSRAHASAREAATRLHRGVRRLFGSNVLPSTVRRSAAFIDRRLHPKMAGGEYGVDVLHAPSTPLPRRAASRSPRRFLTIYDLAYLRFPDLYGAAHQRSTIAAIGSLCPEDHVITTSHFVRNELCDRGVIAGERIHVVPLAAHPALFYPCTDPERLAEIRRRYAIPDGPYVLSVNSPDPRKNVPHAIEAFARAVSERRGVLASLVLAGNAGPGSDRVRQAIEKHPALRGIVILTGFVPDEDLAPLYTGARVFVYPSVYEGFGLPPLEAMQCGTPAITCNTSSLPEVVADAGLMVPPDDVDALAALVLETSRDAARREGLRERAMSRARCFSWERSTAATLRAYRAALES